MPLETGQLLNNRYRIVQLLGQGGFGAVYRAWDTRLSRPCAVKENLDTSAEAQRQFVREASMLANISHPNLPRVTDHFIIPEQGQYLVMDLVEGEDLRAMLKRLGRPLSEAEALKWIDQVLDALLYLHSQNPPIIHRDIKPANIKITPQGNAMLVDFGIAKLYNPNLSTTLGARAVTPGYSPPEQYGQGMTDARADIHALGATLYTLLTAQEPVESVQRTIGATLLTPRQMVPTIRPQTEAVILKSMETSPINRFQSAAEFKTALLSPAPPTLQPAAPPVVVQPTSAFPAQQSIPAAPAARKLPWTWIGAGGGLALLACLVIGVAASGFLKNLTKDAGQTTKVATEEILPTETPAQEKPTLTPGQTPIFPTATLPLVVVSPTLIPPTDTSIPTLPPSPTLSPTPQLEPAIVEPYCAMFKKSPVYVQINQPVTLWWRWDAKTRNLVQDHINAAHYEIYLDGRLIEVQRISEIQYIKNEGFYRVSWYADVGVLSAGSHRAERNLSWDRKIFDGWAYFGPGSKTVTEHHECEIIVR